MIEIAAKIGKCIFNIDEIADFALFLFRLFFGSPYNRVDTWEIFHIIELATMCNRSIPDALGIVSGLVNISDVSKDRLGIFGSKMDAGLGCASLENDRFALWGTLDIERPFYREKLSVMINTVHFLRVEKLAGFAVTNKRIFFP